MHLRTTLSCLIPALLFPLSFASCAQGEASAEERARALWVEYLDWQSDPRANHEEAGILDGAWLERLELAANDASGTRAGSTCRSSLIALLNKLLRREDSEKQILRYVEETPDPKRVPFWAAEFAEARLTRLGLAYWRSDVSTVGVEESIAYFDWARDELEAGLAGADSFSSWQKSTGHRHLWVLHAYAELVRFGVLETDAALPQLRRGYELSVDWMERGYSHFGRRPRDFAFAEFKVELLREPLDPQRLELSFERLAEHEENPDLLIMERLRLQTALHGEGTLPFARDLESWVAGHGVHGPNARVAVLHAARAYLGLEMLADVLRLVEPHLTDEPEWVGDRFRSAWTQMQRQFTLAYIAAADALENEPARRMGVEYLLAHDGTVKGESDALEKARRYAAEQRQQ